MVDLKVDLQCIGRKDYYGLIVKELVVKVI